MTQKHPDQENNVQLNLSPDFVSDDSLLSTEATNIPIPDLYEGHLDGVLITNNQMKLRVKQLAEKISTDYYGKCPILLCVLKGAAPFFHELSSCLAELKQAHMYEYIRVSSYSGTESTHKLTISGLKMDSLVGRDVIVVEDIVDTGNTLIKLLPYIEEEGSPSSMVVCSMLEKRLDHVAQRTELNAKLALDVKYCGFSIPNKFVIGFGLDYNEMYRDLKDIWVISDKGVENEGKI